MNRSLPPLSGSVRLRLCVLGMLFLSALPCPAQAQPTPRSLAQSTHLFRRILFDLGLSPLRSLDELAAEPQEKLLIVLGETDDLEADKLERFVRRGGALLVATDRYCPVVLQPFRVEILGFPVKVNASSPYAYKRSADCIFVEPGAQDFLFENLAIENNLSRVATNRPALLLPAANCKLPSQAVFPLPAWAPDGGGYQYGPAFAVGGDYGRGRVLILSDHSVFINAMMWQPDIDNFDFAYNCVHWLTAGKRKHVLFLEEGEVQQTFEIPLQEPPLPPLPPLKAIVETVDKGLGELEKDNVFNRAIHKAVLNATSPPDKWLRALIVISTVILAVFALARMSQARYRREKVAPLSGFTLAPAAPATLFEQRHLSMEREGNFWEAARALARQGFESGLGLPLQADGVATLPPLRVQGSWWRNRRMRRRFSRLWQLAYGVEPVRVSSGQLKRLGLEIESLKAVLARSGLPHDK